MLIFAHLFINKKKNPITYIFIFMGICYIITGIFVFIFNISLISYDFSETFMNLYFIKPFVRFPAYGVGMIFGYLFANYK